MSQEEGERFETVKKTYTDMHTYQTVEFVKKMVRNTSDLTPAV